MQGFFQRIFTTGVLSLLLVLLLSLIPILQVKHQESSNEVMVSGEPTQLSEATLVELVSNYENLNLQEVDWRGETLFFTASPIVKISEIELYQNCFVLLKNLFRTFSKVETIQLKIYMKKPIDSFRLIAHRTQLRQDPMMENINHLSSKEYLQKMFTWLPMTAQ
ncbi:hypothetical protein SAMN05444392_101451 [Seinonella peptonophila]|uniref:Uncharacterized protein n=1 Tax=Seinonella peptonophila TaxID=112248 RepID=A0A1M4TG56_9BACL|nr:hypothetical protein [Seinonella peptonophila]SHE43426.1 hypothetical protein SAMN05444392_101451 [Seinonella peptonophila]